MEDFCPEGYACREPSISTYENCAGGDHNWETAATCVKVD